MERGDMRREVVEKVVFKGWSLWEYELKVDEGNFRGWRWRRKETIDVVKVRDFRGWSSWRTEVMEEVVVQAGDFRDRSSWKTEVVKERVLEVGGVEG